MSIYKKFLDYCQKNDKILAVYLEGSRVYAEKYIDDFSDYDFLVIVSDIESFVADDDFLSNFGEILIMQKPSDSFASHYNYGSKEPYTYLVQYASLERIDLNFVDVSNCLKYIDKSEPMIEILNKGKTSFVEVSNDIKVFNLKKPSEKEYFDCVNEFYWISLYVKRALNRKEYINAIKIYNDYYIKMLMRMIGFRIGFDKDYSVSLGKNYRFIKNYLKLEEYDFIKSLFYVSSVKDLEEKLIKAIEWFEINSKKVSSLLDFEYTDYSQVKDFILKEYKIKE
jgi:aminoglycoside 6-adenylyltransferase